MDKASEVLLSVMALHGRCGTSEGHLVRVVFVNACLFISLCHTNGEKQAFFNEKCIRLLVSCYNIQLTRGLLLENKTQSKGYIFFGLILFLALWFLAFWRYILALSFLLFRPTGFGPSTQTQLARANHHELFGLI